MSTLAIWLALVRTRLRHAHWRGAPLLALMAEPTRAPSEDERRRGHALAARIARASRFVPRSRCLHRAVLLVELARREALPLRLRLGVRNDAHGFRAHAWAEDAAGEPYGDARAALAGFAPLEAAPAHLEFGR
ncbi:MAG TPA: lasso peptide biosynthesis B2 protein [Xanthomonadales bacterium]|nr:lasso peptide biosynthesis B2 protein [Xanthomonadales bacterium]